MWLVEKNGIAEEPTFYELIDGKQGCPTNVRRVNMLSSKKNQARDETKSEHNKSSCPRKTGINHELASSIEAYARKKQSLYQKQMLIG